MTTKGLSRPIAELRVAAMTLTRLPVGQLDAPIPSMASGRWAYPLIGGLVGGLVGGILMAMHAFGLPPLVGAFLAVAASMAITGALHEDGLADCADGFWGASERERRLEIMRDSQIGTYGAVALILSVGVRVSAIAALTSPFWGILGVAILSRFAMVAALEWLRPARDNGLGAAAAEGGSPITLAAVLALGGVGAVFIASGLGAIIALGSMAVAGIAFAQIAVRKVGGQTGDVLGGLQQVVEITGLVVLSTLAF